ncbi:MAG TPA: energy-coupling factor transporter ATPase [Clostridiaceae bacterium]|nr:energy-coupling factor transporter ATPase [Clostridiaceae bacterium]
MNDSIVKVNDVSYIYSSNISEGREVKALSEINAEFKRGQFIVVIGRNGSGKSTFARLLNALLLPVEGTVIVNGIDTRDEEKVWEIRRSVGMVFQNPDNQIVGTIVEEDVAFGPENLGLPTEEIIKRVADALQAVGISEYSKYAPHLLSGGQKQRVAIAGILAMKPECIVLDEATSMLDPIGRKEVMNVLKKLNKEEGITVIHITHHMDEASMADRVIIVDEGKIVLDGPPKKVFSNVEKVKGLGLDVPQVTELFNELKKEGFQLPDGVLSVDEAVDILADIIVRNP